jgi:hypothetical protein
MTMRAYKKPSATTDLREGERVILAHGEATGHCHEVIAAEGLDLPDAQYFEEPSGRRVLLAQQPWVLRHDEHGFIPLHPENPQQVRQGDVLLTPIGRGAWEVTRQREYEPAGARQVAD